MAENITVEGRVVETSHGESRINKGFIYGFMAITIDVKGKRYSVSFSTKKFNEFGFIPKEGHWVRVTGKVFPAKGNYDPKIKYVSNLEHIEKPEPTLAEKLMEKMRSL